MTDLNLPSFEIPPRLPPRISPDVYWAWVMQNILRLRRNGQLERLMNRPDRQPVDVRFELR